MKRQADVFQHGHLGENPDVLKGPADAHVGDLGGVLLDDALPLEGNAAGGGNQVAGDGIEECGLAGAVGTDETGKFSLIDVNADIIHSPQAAEGNDQIADLQHFILTAHAASLPCSFVCL